MAEHTDFRRMQYEFAAHIRNPEHEPAPSGIEDRRLSIYRELFFSNVSKLLAGTFPVLHQILGDERWQRLARDFYAHHGSHTPYFLEIPREFLEYLENEREGRADDPPFMLELAHYEWVELALSVADEEANLEGIDRDGDLLAERPVVSPLAWSLAYRFPVHRLSPTFQPSEPSEQPTFVVVYRNLGDEVGFIEINAVTARLIELLEDDGDQTGGQVLERIAAELNHPHPETVISGGQQILEDLRQKDIILGTRPTS